MTKKEIAQEYIKFLSKAEVDNIVGLFTIDAIVVSPIYGTKKAQNFYKDLFLDTMRSELKLKGIFEDTESSGLALYFEYIWTVKSGKKVEFDVVDIIEFNEQNEITSLKIIYDTVISRRLINDLNQRS